MNPSAAKTIATRLRPDPRKDALASDGKRAPANPDRVGNALDSIHQNDRVGGLRGDRPAGTHGDPHVRERERRRVVDPVANHHDGAQEAVGTEQRTSSSFSSGVCSA